MSRWLLFLLPCALLFSGPIRADSITVVGNCGGSAERLYTCQETIPTPLPAFTSVNVNNAHDNPLSYNIAGGVRVQDGVPASGLTVNLIITVDLLPTTGNWEMTAWSMGEDRYMQQIIPLYADVNGVAVTASEENPESIFIPHEYGTIGHVVITAHASTAVGSELAFLNFGFNLNNSNPSDAAPEPSTYALALSGIGLLLFSSRRRFS